VGRRDQPLSVDLLDGPRDQAQREAGLALHQCRPGPAEAIAAAATRQPPPNASFRATVRRPARRRVAVMAAAMATTVSLAIGAPVGYSGARDDLGAVAHYFDGND
jgi:hypothetical protein